ncbi:MAG: Si-specific NAD(P)(+) transhydrogenase [Acidobacteria bacterium]|nr:Si-specific NAD(P)(+) transhydrogenase [Acidobacteriota bacterium]
METPALERFDLVVLGSGPAGEKGAAQAAYFGKKVALVEKRAAPGGVSVHTGTLPSKTLREAALYITGFRHRELYGMTLRIDREKSLRQLVGRLQDVTTRQVRQITRNIERHRIERVLGRGTFTGPREITVTGEDGSPVRRLSAPVILIAVGSSPLPPRGIALDDPDLEDSDSILDLDRIPKTLAVVGGGVIGCEYASIFAALGTEVTLIEGRERLLGFLDSELSAALKTALERMGTEILLGDAVETVTRAEERKTNALELRLKSGRLMEADKVLFSAGRKGNTEGLGLDLAGVVTDDKGRIVVDESFQTSAKGIYAAGDVIGFPSLAATSMEQGRVAMRKAFGIGRTDGFARVFPYGIYTVPEISMIGSTEEELRSAGVPYEIGRARYENNARGQINGDIDGFVKLLFDPESKRLLGAHLIGDEATELIHVPQMVMTHGGGLEDFLQAIFNVPTLSECFKYAAYDGLQRLAHKHGGAPLEASESHRGERLPPGARAWFVGVDLTDPYAREPRPVTVAFMDRWRRVQFRTWTFDPLGTGLLPDEVLAEGFVLAIDGPQGLPQKGQKLRQAEKLLKGSGKTAFALPKLEVPYPGFVPGSVALFSALREKGHGVLGEAGYDETVLIEAYPDDLWTRWTGHKLPKRILPSGRRARFDCLRGFGVELPAGEDATTHDQLDAAAAAFAAYLWATGRAREIGVKPEFDPAFGFLREGTIVSV